MKKLALFLITVLNSIAGFTQSAYFNSALNYGESNTDLIISKLKSDGYRIISDFKADTDKNCCWLVKESKNGLPETMCMIFYKGYDTKKEKPTYVEFIFGYPKYNWDDESRIRARFSDYRNDDCTEVSVWAYGQQTWNANGLKFLYDFAINTESIGIMRYEVSVDKDKIIRRERYFYKSVDFPSEEGYGRPAPSAPPIDLWSSKRSDSINNVNPSSDTQSYFSDNLKNRSLISDSPKPSYTGKSRGKVVMNVTIDSSGSVTSASFEPKRSTTDAVELVEAARNAALRTRFTPSNISGERGTITYIFSY